MYVGKKIFEKKILWLVFWYFKYDYSSIINIFYYDIFINLIRIVFFGKIWLFFWRLGIGDVLLWSGYIYKLLVESKRISIGVIDIYFDIFLFWVFNGKLFRIFGEFVFNLIKFLDLEIIG